MRSDSVWGLRHQSPIRLENLSRSLHHRFRFGLNGRVFASFRCHEPRVSWSHALRRLGASPCGSCRHLFRGALCGSHAGGVFTKQKDRFEKGAETYSETKNRNKSWSVRKLRNIKGPSKRSTGVGWNGDRAPCVGPDTETGFGRLENSMCWFGPGFFG